MPDLNITSTMRQPGHQLGVTAVVMTPHRQTFFSGSLDNTIKHWNLSTGELLQTLHIKDKNSTGVTGLAITPDGQTLISGGNQGKILLWDLDTGELLDTINDGNLDISKLAISPYGQILVSGSTVFSPEGCVASISAWHLPTRKQIYKLGYELGEVDAKALAITPDGQTLITEQEKNCIITLNAWDLNTGKLLHQLSQPSSWWFSTLAISPNGKILAYSSSQQGIIQLFQLSSGELLHTLSAHTNPVNALVFSPDNLMLFSGSQDKTIKQWSMDTGELLHTFSGHSEGISDLAISQDGQTLVSGSKDCTVTIWQLF